MPTYPAANPFQIQPIDLPAAQGVRPGPAYPNFSGEPTVIVNQPSGGFGIPSVPNLPSPGAPALPDWIQPQAGNAGSPNYPNLAGAPPVVVDAPWSGLTGNWQQNAAANTTGISPLQHALNVLASNFAHQQNMNAFALHDWNRNMWAANPTGGEGGAPTGLLARLGLLGSARSGKLRGGQA